MTKYYALVLVPGDPAEEEELCETAYTLLLPFMRDEKNLEKEYHFDYFIAPDDLADEDKEDFETTWQVSEMLEDFEETFPELMIEAILTPDGKWHETEPGQLWDDEGWVKQARRLFKKYPEHVALRHIMHI